MLPPGHRWVHVVFNTRNTWLHGDPRGFRDRNHRLHSTGDYKHRPPTDEHARVRAYYRTRAGEKRVLDAMSCQVALERLVARVARTDCVLLAAAVSPVHTHVLLSVPGDHAETDALLAEMKRQMTQGSSRAISRPVWAAGQTIEEIKNAGHQRATYFYIRDKQGADAWVWTFREPRVAASRPPRRQGARRG